MHENTKKGEKFESERTHLFGLLNDGVPLFLVELDVLQHRATELSRTEARPLVKQRQYHKLHETLETK